MELQNTIGDMNQSLKAHTSLREELLACIRNCQEGQQTCYRMIEHCLSRGGAHAEPAHIQILLDCAQICATAVDFMVRNSSLHAKLCGVCADACKTCAEDCERLNDDSMMAACAEVCRRCEQTCREMSVMSH